MYHAAAGSAQARGKTSAGHHAPAPENRGEAAGVAGAGGGDGVCQGWGRTWRNVSRCHHVQRLTPGRGDDVGPSRALGSG